MRIAGKIGNFNDKHSHHDSSSEATLRWKVVDRVVSFFNRRGF